MRHRRVPLWAIVFAIIIITLYGGPSYPLEAQEVEKGRIIRKIEIQGNQRVGTAAVKGNIRLKEGDLYTQEAVNRDVSGIWAMGFFDNVEVALESYEDGLKLTFYVTERPVVKSITFKGNEQVGTNKLLDSIELKERDYLKYYLLKLDEDKIKEVYLKKGFHFVEIHSEVKRTDGEVEIVYNIKEGPQAAITKVNFKGNKSFPAKKLVKQVKSRRRRFPTILFKGIFDQDKFDEDKDRLREFYVNNGWLDAQVRGDVSYNADKTEIYLNFSVEENERYSVSKITMQGNTLFASKELTKVLELKEGEPFLAEELQNDAQKIRVLYGEQGYISAEVRTKRVFSPQEPKLELVFEIEENERVFIEEIKIAGNDKTKDNVIRRELLFFPGERLDTVKVLNSQQKLLATGYFDVMQPGSVMINTEPGTKPDYQNVIVDVKEGRSGMLKFGGGFGANVGLFGDISYTDRNFDLFDFPQDFDDFLSGDAFRGGGQVLNLKFSPGLRRTEAVLSITQPSVFDSPYSAGGNIFFFTRGRERYNETRKGLRFSVGRQIIRGLSIRLTPEYQNIDLTSIGESAAGLVKEERGTSNKLGAELALTLDRRDNTFLPTKGYQAETAIEGAGIDVTIWKYSISGKKYLTLADIPWWGKHILSVGSSVNLVDSYTNKTVPIFERFFAGGSGSIRGFDFRGISPRDAATGRPLGGNVLLLAGIEENFPIFKDFLRGVLFLDAGKVDTKVTDVNFGKMRAAFGVGIRFTVPMLGRMTVGMDFGFPLLKETGDDTKVFSFNMGGPGAGF